MAKPKKEEKPKITRKLKGTVVSDKMDKTIIVRVETKQAHPLYKKIVKSHKRYFVHDEDGKCKVGDEVIIEETSPISKNKTWIVSSE